MSRDLPSSVGAIVVAAGRSRRMDGIDKLWTSLARPGEPKPLLAYPLAAFEACPSVSRVVLVVSEETVERARSLVLDEALDKVRAVVPGGERRQDSVRAGLDALGGCDWVAIHDGARPLVTVELIEQGLLEARETGASCPVLPVADTVKEIDEAGFAVHTLQRARLRLAQTPQVFRYDLLLEAHRQAGDEATDDAAMVEALGVRVRLFPGTRRNVKVTTPEDLALVHALLTP
ncbi:MAG: 2-C-methyl-D-erythritol 4-phosphate cytidylyltransferase [Dehalococcoidia bacterium]